MPSREPPRPPDRPVERDVVLREPAAFRAPPVLFREAALLRDPPRALAHRLGVGDRPVPAFDVVRLTAPRAGGVF